MIIHTPELLKTYVETLNGRDPEDMTTITLRIGDLRQLTKDIPSNYTSLVNDRRQPSECDT